MFRSYHMCIHILGSSLIKDREDALSWEYEDGEYGAPRIALPNGNIVTGEDAAGEYFYYEMRIALNEIGKHAFRWIEQLKKIGLIEITPGTSGHNQRRALAFSRRLRCTYKLTACHVDSLLHGCKG